MQKIDKEIISLFTKLQDGNISPKEKKNLSEWANKHHAYKALFDKMHKPDTYSEWKKEVESINTSSAWMKFKNATKKQKGKKVYLKLLRYAAAIAIALSVGVTVYYFISDQQANQTIIAESKTVKPSSKAQLKLSDGKIIQLGNDKGRIKESDGTLINKDSSLISYLSNKIDDNNQPLINEISVGRGEEYQIQLADGTNVWLNSMSSIKFPVRFSNTTREVEISGEVYFEVAKNKLKPFIVHTPVHDVNVLGTAFNISCYEGDATTQTTLLEGKVSINNITGGFDKVELQPGMQYLYNKKNQTREVKKVQASDYVAWVTGYFQFEEKTLEQIFKQLQRWYDIEVHFKNEQHRQEYFTGRLPRYEKVDFVLNMMEKVSDVDFEINDKTIIIK